LVRPQDLRTRDTFSITAVSINRLFDTYRFESLSLRPYVFRGLFIFGAQEGFAVYLSCKSRQNSKPEKTFNALCHTPGPVFWQAFALFLFFLSEIFCLLNYSLFILRQQISFG